MVTSPCRSLAARWSRVLLGGCLALAGCSTIDGAPFETAEARIEISAPGSVSAGQPYTVEVRLVGAENQAGATVVASLAVDSGYGPTLIEAPVVGGSARFDVSGAEVASSGVVRLDVVVGSQRATATTIVEPGAATDPLVLFVGPRTVLADGVDFSMIVAVPVDQFGNPVPTGTDVSFEMYRPGQQVTQQTASTAGLLAFIPIVGGTTAGRTLVAASLGDVTGPEQSFLQVAGMAAPFQLVLSDEVPSADGATLFEVETSQLFDRFGNELPDGTAVSLDMEYLESEAGQAGEEGRRRLWGTTLDGKAIFVVEAPPVPGNVELVASASGAVSEPLGIRFEPAVTNVTATVANEVLVDQSVWVIEVGPVLSTTGAYIADGTSAEITIDGATMTISLEDGQGSVTVDSDPGDVRVSVLGVDAVVESTP